MTVGPRSARTLRGAPLVILLCLVMAVGWVCRAAAAEEVRRLPETSLIRIEGYLGPPHHGPKPVADLQLLYRGKEYRLQATQLRALAGKRPDSAPAFDAAFHQPLTLRGADAMLQRLGTARPADHIEITAYQRLGSHELLVTEVTVVPPPTAARTPVPTPQ